MSGKKKAGTESARQAYEKLKANKEALSRLGEFKDLIIAAPNDGVSDAELIQILKMELPGLKIAVKKLVELRAKWAAESDDKDGRLLPKPVGGQ